MRAYLIAVTLAAVATTAAAYDPIVLNKGWVRVDRFESEECAGEVGSNGQFYVLSAGGFAPGETLRLTIENGDMPPIDRLHRANERGGLEQYYIPFRPNRGEGGVVLATISGENCSVPLTFAWQRAKGWDERSSPQSTFAY